MHASATGQTVGGVHKTLLPLRKNVIQCSEAQYIKLKNSCDKYFAFQ